MEVRAFGPCITSDTDLTQLHGCIIDKTTKICFASCSAVLNSRVG